MVVGGADVVGVGVGVDVAVAGGGGGVARRDCGGCSPRTRR